MEKTFLMVKPDGVKRGLVGEVIGRLERKGFAIEAMKMMTIERSLAERHYAAHDGKPFFKDLIDYVTSGPVVAMVISGRSAVSSVRKMMGATDPSEAEPGSVRGDLATDISENIVHGSDSLESAKREIELFFGLTSKWRDEPCQ
ncbi:MAG: nucleoside-diphosphate kinase [Actinomycetota bacterium]|nr:nucleoside-diphosphate kinase [Actinomycetota bacterium]